MLKVILADDEPVILLGLAKLIPWDKYGAEIIGEASDGEELLTAIRERSPDIVITDISMPGLTGIDVLKRLKELGKKTKVIFISAYQEFSYAQDAISYGAVDYLVKPIDRKKLEQVLGKTISMIQEATEQVSKESKLIVYEKQQQTRTLHELLDRLTDGEMVSEQALQGMFGDRNGYVFTAIVVRQEDNPVQGGSWLEGERKLVQYAMQNVMEEVINDKGRGWVTVKDDSILAMIKHNEADDQIVLHICSQIQSSINRFLKLSVTIGVGLPGGLDEAAKSYRQACTAAGYAYFAGTNQVFRFSELSAEPKRDSELLDSLEKELIKCLLVHQSQRLDDLLKQFLGTVGSVSWGNRDYAVNLCYTMLLTLYRELANAGFFYRTGKEEQQQLAMRLSGFETFDEMSGFVRDELAQAAAAVSGSASSKEKQQLLQIKDYIEAHYDDEISLDKMASLFFMNSYYFSSFFKKHTGKNFKQYVTEVRMKHALKLLQQTDLMVYEIAEKVGYNNARQFSDMFKKYFGKLPGELRQK